MVGSVTISFSGRTGSVGTDYSGLQLGFALRYGADCLEAGIPYGDRGVCGVTPDVLASAAGRQECSMAADRRMIEFYADVIGELE